uniref:Lamina-associated polypeptide 2 alpha C-terminal domain-containing protein n=1 Tax=Xenopus tropicalis TaxID=8364 RepID=A0A6I8SMB5_XENTR
MAEGRSGGLFPRAGGKAPKAAQMTFFSCSICQNKIPGGQAEPLCRSCSKDQATTPAPAGNTSLTTAQPVELPLEGTSTAATVGPQAEPPAPLWAVQLSQSLASLQGLPSLADSLGKALTILTSKPSHKRKRSGDGRGEANTHSPSDVSSGELGPSGSEGELPPSDVSSGEEEDEEESHDKNKDTHHDINSIITGVTEILNISQTAETQSHPTSLFKRQHKSPIIFPSHDQLNNIIQDEWNSPERKFQATKKFSKSYPFSKDLMDKWSIPPSVDAPVSRLSKSTTLPVTDAAAFKDPSDRRLEGFLRAVFTSSGSALRPALASAWVSRAIQAWSESLLRGLEDGTPRSELISSARSIGDASAYLCDATLDTSQIIARTSALAVAARRTLWLKNWSADLSSKKSLTSLPFKGNQLFGEELTKIISQATGGKSTFLPQTKPRMTNSNRRGKFFRGQTGRYNRRTNLPQRSNFRNKTGDKNRSTWKPNKTFNKSTNDKTTSA